MSRTRTIIDKIARLTRVVRLKRHLAAVADAVKNMSPADLQQLRVQLDAALDGARTGPAAPPPAGSDLIETLGELCLDRQLSSDSAIVRIRYVAKWLGQVIRLTVGSDDLDIRELHRSAVTVLRSVQGASASARGASWFISNDKKVS